MNLNKIDKIILLVGLMGSGKTSVGKRLAKNLTCLLSMAIRKLKKRPASRW